MPKRYEFSPEQIADVEARYRSGETATCISRDFACGPQTIARLVKELGAFESRVGGPRSRFTATQKQEMLDRYEAGENFTELGRRFGCERTNIRFVLLKLGFNPRPRGRAAPSAEALAAVRRRREEGASHRVVAKEFGVEQQTVLAWCRRMGMPLDPRMSGPAHHAWQGGRHQHHGYVMVLIGTAHPMAAMARTNGYVPEHRLVMAESVGRPLTSSETVHHINGDRLDNRLENLQLRQGNHGKGSVMACLDCGSHNLGHIPIK